MMKLQNANSSQGSQDTWIHVCVVSVLYYYYYYYYYYYSSCWWRDVISDCDVDHHCARCSVADCRHHRRHCCCCYPAKTQEFYTRLISYKLNCHWLKVSYVACNTAVAYSRLFVRILIVNPIVSSVSSWGLLTVPNFYTNPIPYQWNSSYPRSLEISEVIANDFSYSYRARSTNSHVWIRITRSIWRSTPPFFRNCTHIADCWKVLWNILQH